MRRFTKGRAKAVRRLREYIGKAPSRKELRGFDSEAYEWWREHPDSVRELAETGLVNEVMRSATYHEHISAIESEEFERFSRVFSRLQLGYFETVSSVHAITDHIMLHARNCSLVQIAYRQTIHYGVWYKSLFELAKDMTEIQHPVAEWIKREELLEPRHWTARGLM